MENMERYKNIQNPQLYQQILEEERRRRAREADQKITSSNLHNKMLEIQRHPSNAPSLKPPASSISRRQADEAMVKTSSTNFYTQMRKVAKAENTARQTRMPMTTQWDQMSAQQKSKVPSTNLYSMFREIEAGEKNDWASLGKNNLPGDEEQTQAIDDPNMHFMELEPIPVVDGKYQPGFGSFAPAEPENIFKEKDDALGETLEQTREEVEKYLKLGVGNELIDMGDAKDFGEGFMSPEDFDALSQDQKDVLLLWTKLDGTRQEIYEHLIFYGERGEYTWDNYYAVLDKMDAIIKPDNRFVEGLKEFTYLTVKRLRGLSDPLNGAAAWSIGTIVYGISKVFGGSETGDYLEDLSAKIIMNKGADLQDHWLAEWLGIRKGVVQQGEKEENAWRSIGKLAEYTLIRGAVGGVGGGRFGGTAANFWSAVDTWVVAFEQAYEEGMDVEDAREYAYKRAQLEFGTTQLIDGLRLGKFAISNIGKTVTEYLSQFGWGKAIIYFLNIIGGSAAAAIAGDAAKEAEEDYNLRPERDPEERRNQFIKDFAWNLGFFGLVEIAGWIIKRGQGMKPGQPDGAPGNPNAPKLPPGNGGGKSPNVPSPIPPSLLPPGGNGVNPGRLPPIPPNLFPPRGDGVSPDGGAPTLPVPPGGKNTPASPSIPGRNSFAPALPTPGQTDPFDHPETFNPDSDDISPEQERQMIEGLTGHGSAQDFTFVPGRDPRLPLPGGETHGLVKPPPGTPSHDVLPDNLEDAARYQEEEENSKVMRFFKDAIGGVKGDEDAYADSHERDIIEEPQEYEEVLDDGVNRYQQGYMKHMVEGELATGKEKYKGIKGCHNFENLKRIISENNIKIERMTQSKEFPGILEVEYRLPIKDTKGNIIPGQYRNSTNIKTVYDPHYYTDEQIAEWGREAMRGAKQFGKLGRSNRYIGTANNGMRFEGYYNSKTGEITNFYPVL